MREIVQDVDGNAAHDPRALRRAELLSLLEEEGAPRGPRAAWRAHRPRATRRDLWRFWLPLALVCTGAVAAAHWQDVRGLAASQIERVKAHVAEAPDFAVRRLEITGRRETPREVVLAALDWDGETPSSLELDVAEARRRLIATPWVEDAGVALDPSGTLRLQLTEREAAAVWRTGGAHWLVAADGTPIATVDGPKARLDLPYLIGPGADEAVAEARALLLSAPEAASREVLALARRGGRRWDMISSNGYVVKLPAQRPLEALRRYARGGWGERLAPYGVTALDLRRPSEPPVLTLESGANDLRLEALAALRKPDPKRR